MLTSLDWKNFYATERETILPPTLDFWLDIDAPPLPEKGFLVFPHTKLMRSAEQIVPVVLAVLHGRADEVVALGPLHGGRRQDAEIVKRARAGDEAAIREVRGLHSGDSELAAEEFCLDNFEWLLGEFCKRLDRRPPRVHRRHPFLTGSEPETLPGFRRLKSMVDSGVPVVATGDLIHHGLHYNTPAPELRSDSDAATLTWAGGEILSGFNHLGSGDVGGFEAHARKVANDFRHAGPVMKALFPNSWTTSILSLSLVSYEDVENLPPPNWVASALVDIRV